MSTPGSAHKEPLPASRIAAQWFCLVGPPLAAFAQQQLAYSLVDAACLRGSALPQHLATLLSLGVIGVAFFLSKREWRLGGPNAGFFSFVGILMCGVGATLVLAQWLPVLFLDPCVH